jgi:hypothetical protein
MSLKDEAKSITEELRKAQTLIVEARESLNSKSAEATKCQGDLQKAEQGRQELEERLKALQKDYDLHRHNAELVSMF